MIQAYYDSDPAREWARLERHRTEFAVTLRALREHLPPPPARVLDCGGGPGRYAIELAAEGYTVVLFDLSPACLAFARERAAEAGVALAGYEQGTATDLARFAAGSFDAVLLLGPLYHLLSAADRRQALAEACRVLAPGGPLLAACITRYAALRDMARRRPMLLVEQPDAVDRVLEEGILLPRPWPRPGAARPPAAGQDHAPPGTPDRDVRAGAAPDVGPAAFEGGWDFVAYFACPAEIGPLLWQAGLEVQAVLGVEGLVSMIENEVNGLAGPAWDAWVNLNYQAAADPALHAAVEHLLAVARKPRWRPVLRDLARQLAAEGIAYAVTGGASAALHGVPLAVKDIDIELSAADAYRCAELWAAQVVMPVELRTGPLYRSHFGRFDFGGVSVEVMGDLQRPGAGGGWLPTYTLTRAVVDLDGVPVTASWLEEETIGYLRRGRLGRAAACLAHCDRDRLASLLAGGTPTHVVTTAGL